MVTSWCPPILVSERMNLVTSCQSGPIPLSSQCRPLNPHTPIPNLESRIHYSFHSALLLFNQDLRIERCRTERADITPRGFIVIRLPHLFAVWAANSKRFVFFWL